MMEAFLGFRFPEHIGNFHIGMREALAKVPDDQSLRTHVERYLHTYSHNGDSNVTSTVDSNEATTVLRSLFEMMKIVDPEHLSAMRNAFSIDEANLLRIPAATLMGSAPSSLV